MIEKRNRKKKRKIKKLFFIELVLRVLQIIDLLKRLI